MTDKQKHTAGPWHVSPFVSGVYRFDVIGPNGEDIGYANPSDGSDEAEEYPATENARLMAAAPELLSALKALMACCTNGEGGISPEPHCRGGWLDCMVEARFAISKAEGV